MDSRFRGNDIEKVGTVPTFSSNDVSKLSTAVFREMILPKLVEEVNTGKNFAQTRQVYQSVILAAWYKKALKDSLLGRIYADKSKVAGVESDVKDIKEKVYDQYLQAFKKGAYNVIKEEANGTDDPIPRKYFSGGENFLNLPVRYVRASSAVNNVLLSVSASSALGDRVIVRAITPESIAEQRTRMKDVEEANRLSASSAVGREASSSSSIKPVVTREQAIENYVGKMQEFLTHKVEENGLGDVRFALSEYFLLYPKERQGMVREILDQMGITGLSKEDAILSLIENPATNRRTANVSLQMRLQSIGTAKAVPVLVCAACL